MRRIIKFRGKSLKDGVWLIGSHFTDGAEEYIIPQTLLDIHDYEDYQVDPDTVGQYTGLKDRNGQEIYEGDVVERGRTYTIEWWESNSTFFAVCLSGSAHLCLGYWSRCMTVIGNIHDNPELVRKEEEI